MRLLFSYRIFRSTVLHDCTSDFSCYFDIQCHVSNFCRDPSSGVINSLEAKLVLSDTNYKNTPKVTWLAVTDHAPATPTVCVIFDHLITKGVLKPEDDFKDFVNYNSKVMKYVK